MKVLHNNCNMYTLDLTDIYQLALGPVVLMSIHTYKSNKSCKCYNHIIYVNNLVQSNKVFTKLVSKFIAKQKLVAIKGTAKQSTINNTITDMHLIIMAI